MSHFEINDAVWNAILEHCEIGLFYTNFHILQYLLPRFEIILFLLSVK